MKITMVGHCTVSIETGGKRIITDPWFGTRGNLVYERLSPPAKARDELTDVDLVLISHHHWDHIDNQYLRQLADRVPIIAPTHVKHTAKWHGVKNIVEIDKWSSRCFGEITITVVPASHTTVAIGFIVQSEDRQIYFAGDTYYHPFMKKIGQLFHLDVALVPVTTYRFPMTMGEKGAVRAAEALLPDVIIPIHLGIRPRLPLFCTNHTPEGFRRRVRAAGLESSVVILREGQSYEI